MKTGSRNCAPRSIAPPAASCWIRNNSTRNSNRSCGTPKPSPISDTVIFVAPPDREARLESRAPLIANPQPNKFAKIQGVDNVIVRLQNSLDQVEGRQLAAPSSVE